VRSASELRRALDAAVRDCKPRLIVDLSGVPFMDSSGLVALTAAHKACRNTTRTIVVCPPSLRRLFEVTRLDSILCVVASLAEARVA
jgi:anti-sigma B factor antagonist